MHIENITIYVNGGFTIQDEVLRDPTNAAAGSIPFRRQIFTVVLLRQRQAWRHRSRLESAEAGRSLRRDLRHAADAVDESERGTGQRHLQDRERRRDLDEAHERTAHGPHRQDRTRYLREESRDPPRGAHQRQPGCCAWHAWRMHGRTASRARGRRDVSHRQRRRELDEGELRGRRSDPEGQRLHRFRRRGLRRLHAGADRSQ
jgi:hypothetical protein